MTNITLMAHGALRKGETMDELKEMIAEAIAAADVGYNLRLTSLVNGVHTYTLTYDDGELLKFDCIEDGYAHIAARKRARGADLVLKVIEQACGRGRGRCPFGGPCLEDCSECNTDRSYLRQQEQPT